MPQVSKRSGFYQYRFENPKVLAFTSTRAYNARFDEEAPGERIKLCRDIQIDPDRMVGAEQTHGTDLQIVGPQEVGRGSLYKRNAYQGTDGFITIAPHIVLSIKTADCLPLFLVDTRMPALCLIHAGWKGARDGIAQKGVALLWKLYGIEPSGLEAVLGPCIQYEDYEVGEDFKRHFPGFVSQAKKDSRFHFDLPGYVKKCLIDSGLKEENILDTELSTYRKSDDFFSFRREGDKAGRMLSFMYFEE